jgi:hypothetical protein
MARSRKASQKRRKASKKSQAKSQRRRRQQQQQQQGGTAYTQDDGAPKDYSLFDTMAGKQSMQQGLNYLQYHRAQHGGMAPFPQSVEGQVLGDGLRGPALMGTLDKAYADIAGLKDPQPTPIPSLADGRVAVDGAIPLMGVSKQTGGKKRKGKRSQKSQRRSQKSQKSQRRSQKSQRRRRQQGGEMPALGYQLVGAPGLLLETSKQYSDAGLNPDYTGGISTNYLSTEQMDANARDRV